MRSHLTAVHQLTFEVSRYEKDDWIAKKKEILSVTIRHSPQQNHWNITSEDDWSHMNDKDRVALENESALLVRIMARMLCQKSQADLTPEYLMWLREDLRCFYIGEKLGGAKWKAHSISHDPFRGSRPDVARPPDMYAGYLSRSYHGVLHWVCRWGHEIPRVTDPAAKCCVCEANEQNQ